MPSPMAQKDVLWVNSVRIWLFSAALRGTAMYHPLPCDRQSDWQEACVAPGEETYMQYAAPCAVRIIDITNTTK